MMFRKLLKNSSRLTEFRISRTPRASTFAFKKPCRSKSPLFARHQKHASPLIGDLPSANLRLTRSYCDDPEEEDHLPKEDFSKPLVRLTFITADAEEIEIQGRVGLTLMQEAARHEIPLVAACRGQLSCTSCHCYVEEHAGKGSDCLDPFLNDEVMQVNEIDLLDNLPDCKPNSRLTCQIIISQDCENVKFRITEAASPERKNDDNQVDVSLERNKS